MRCTHAEKISIADKALREYVEYFTGIGGQMMPLETGLEKMKYCPWCGEEIEWKNS